MNLATYISAIVFSFRPEKLFVCSFFQCGDKEMSALELSSPLNEFPRRLSRCVEPLKRIAGTGHEKFICKGLQLLRAIIVNELNFPENVNLHKLNESIINCVNLINHR